MPQNKFLLETGLTSQEAQDRLLRYGYNEIIQENQTSAALVFLRQFKSPLVLILILACCISILIREIPEALAIGTILVLNAIIGFFHEYRAETAIAALNKITSPRATVVRNQGPQLIFSREVVPGDLLLLEAGDIVAADATLLESYRLQANEAILTGESFPVVKTPIYKQNPDKPFPSQNLVFKGTTISTGTARALVSKTGMNTELGKIADMMASVEPTTTPLQKQMSQLGRTLLYFCLSVLVLILFWGYLQGYSWTKLLTFTLSLAVALVPEGMAAIVTIALAVGIQRMAAKKALVRNLNSVETLGLVSIIGTDKTGTLTTGTMRVGEMWGKDTLTLLNSAACCCDAELTNGGDTGTGDPTDIAILLAAREHGIGREQIERENPRLSSEPFDADRRKMSIRRQNGYNYIKGAPETIFPLCASTTIDRKKFFDKLTAMSTKGFRVLAVAVGKGDNELTNLEFQGLIGITDPPRPEVRQSLQDARDAGITTIMITGDHPETAISVAKDLGLSLDDKGIETRVFARATPADKLQLIRQWKEHGAIVAMTGDGVNDAPALKEAHIGIAMGSGTEVTKQAADLVLVDDNFSTIIAAIKEGRNVFENIRKAIVYLLTGNFAELIFVLLSIFLGLPIPLHATHLLWINLVTDALPALSLLADPVSPRLMKMQPRSIKEKIIGQGEWTQIFLVGSLEALVVFGIYAYHIRYVNELSARNLAFSALVLSQLFRIFGARSFTANLWHTGFTSNIWLLSVVTITATLQMTLHFIPFTQNLFKLVPPNFSDFAVILFGSLIPMIFVEIEKIIMSRYGPFFKIE